MKRTCALSLVLIGSIMAAFAFQASAKRLSSIEAMTLTAKDFIDSLDEEQRPIVLQEFDSEMRVDWTYVPRFDGRGLALKEMKPEQKALAHALLSAGLSQAGYAKAMTVMSLEFIILANELERLGKPGKFSEIRHPEIYHFAIYGTPSDEGAWGYSIEGHHVSLNFTIVDGQFAASTPMFYGGNPHEVMRGPRKGLRVIGAEEDLGRALLNSLTPKEQAKAIIGETPPKDIFTRFERKVEFEGPPRGLAKSEMNEMQKLLLQNLIDEYIYNLPDDLARKRIEQVEQAGGDIYFAWMGPVKKAPGDPFYYRVQAPTFLIEIDNIQNNANHSHSVWRDYEGDFGRDLLAEHHAHDH